MTELDRKQHSARSMWSGSQEIHFRVSKISRQWTARPHLWQPPTDLYETDEAYVVRAEIAGMRDAELNISLEGRVLALHGVRQLETERAAYHQMEVRFGEFLSLVELPGLADEEGIKAEYDDGFLIVSLPKAGA